MQIFINEKYLSFFTMPERCKFYKKFARKTGSIVECAHPNCPYGNQEEVRYYNLDKITICKTNGLIKKVEEEILK